MFRTLDTVDAGDDIYDPCFQAASETNKDLPMRDEIDAKDIAASLVLLKRKHNLSVNCVNDIIDLLKSLRVSNIPSSWYKVKRLLTESKATCNEYLICPVCDRSMRRRSPCRNCPTDHSIKLQSFYLFSITDQLQSILINNPNLDFLRNSKRSSMRDIHDGAVFQSVRTRTSNPTVTMTMNIDGVQLSRGSQSTLWPILFVVNELPPNVRFSIENIILAGVWPGPSKPSRDQIRLMYRPLIDELLSLEHGHAFTLFDDHIEVLEVYLIAGCCDKPAQAVVQCISEPIAVYGCGRCEISGDMFFS